MWNAAGALPPFLLTLWSLAETLAHLGCRLCGLWMADVVYHWGPLVPACGRGEPSIVHKVRFPGFSGRAGWGPAT